MGVIISFTKERGKGIAMNVLTQMVSVELDERDETEIEEYNVKDLTLKKKIPQKPKNEKFSRNCFQSLPPKLRI